MATIGIVVGTRPSFIMAAPIIRAIDATALQLRIVHTGQHFSDNMDRVFFAELGIREPDHRVPQAAETGGSARQIAHMLVGVDDWIAAAGPAALIVLGDTNSNLAAALAARKRKVPFAHVEAGERAFDDQSPEEENRVVIDHLAAWLLATNERSRRNLLREGLAEETIFVVGNPIVDSLRQWLDSPAVDAVRARRRAEHPRPYAVMTLHRQESVDRREVLAAILDGVGAVARALDLGIVAFLHPRTLGNIDRLGLQPLLAAQPRISVVPAAGYVEFIGTLAGAALCLTDSGGVQQEACVLEVPCVTLLDKTPWPQTVEVGANMLGGRSPDTILPAARTMLARRGGGPAWRELFGQGDTGRRIADLLVERLSMAG